MAPDTAAPDTAAPGSDPQTPLPDHVPVVIVGGGLSGLSLAAGLGQSGIQTMVLDRDPAPTRLAASYDGRTTALSYGTRQILDAIGLWPMIADHAEPITDILITDEGAPVRLTFDHREVADRSGGEPFGHIVDNPVLRRALAERLEALDTVHHAAPITVATVEQDADEATVVLADGRRVRADLVIAADGRRSQVREAAGIRTHSWDYRQTAVVCSIATEKPHGGVALEHFRPTGPFAVLPMAPDAEGRARCSVVWTERPSGARRLMALPVPEFEAQMERLTGPWLGRVTLASDRFAYPLNVVHAARYWRGRVAVVGDAGHGIHPIAGQGLNLGLRDIAVLVELLTEQARLGLDLGDPTLLRRYERRRRPDNTAMIAATDGLNRLFGTKIAPIALARDLGLAAVGRLPPVKRFFMLQAMGLAGDLPRLLQPRTL